MVRKPHFDHYPPKETGWYYLQSRYYDPIVKRFLNADTLAYTGQGFLGYNMFEYANNNPSNISDSEGNRPVWEGPHGELTDEGKSIPNIVLNTEPREDAPEDITEELDSLMKAHAEELEKVCQEEFLAAQFSDSSTFGTNALDASATSALLSTVLYFVSKVKTNGDWDLKNNDYPYYKRFAYNGRFYSGEDIGNIHYGFVGSVVFGRVTLHFGAGGYQLISGAKLENWTYFFDSARDYAMVDYGIDLYNGR